MRDYSEFYPALKGYARKLTRTHADAEDLFQTTVMKLLEADNTFDGKNTMAWAATIMRNHLFGQLRAANHSRRSEMPPDYELRAAPCFDPAEFAEVLRALGSMPKHHREIIILRAQGYTPEETALALRLAVGTVKSRTARARQRLREMTGRAIYPVSEDKERHHE